MNIPKWIIFIMLVVLAIMAYAFWPDARVAVDNAVASAVIVLNGITMSVVTTPVWQMYFAPYLGWWGLLSGMLVMAVVWASFIQVRRWMVHSAAKEAPVFQGAPTYQPLPTTQTPQQVQPVVEQKKEA